MKVLVTGDWHIGLSTYGVLNERGVNSRLIDVETAINRAIDIGVEKEISLFVCAGDIFHTNKPTPSEQLVFWRILQRLEAAPYSSRFIIGNHDYDSKLGSNHALKLFMEIVKGSNKIKIYDQTDWETFKSQSGDMLELCYFPYHAEEPKFPGGAHHRALVCHSHLEGAVVGAEPFEIKSDTATKFKDLPVDFVFAGHFHKPQVLSEKPLAFYPGSIQAVDFNERNDIKGIVVVDTIKKTYEPIAIDTRKLVQMDVVDVDLILQNPLHNVKDAIVKINVKLSEQAAEKFDEHVIRKKLTECGAHSIASINLDIVKKEVKRDPTIRIDVDLKSNFKKYVGDRDYGERSSAVHEAGMNIIEQCAK